MTGSGRWVSMTLRKQKKQKGAAPRMKPALVVHDSDEEDEGEDTDAACKKVIIVDSLDYDLLLHQPYH